MFMLIKNNFNQQLSNIPQANDYMKFNYRRFMSHFPVRTYTIYLRNKVSSEAASLCKAWKLTYVIVDV